jgi:hypothetical protein
MYDKIAFQKLIGEKISLATLSSFDNGVNKYVIFIKNNLKLITSSTSNEKEQPWLTYIFWQLKHCPNFTFQLYVPNLHITYQEGKYPTLTH